MGWPKVFNYTLQVGAHIGNKKGGNALSARLKGNTPAPKPPDKTEYEQLLEDIDTGKVAPSNLAEERKVMLPKPPKPKKD